MVSRNFRDATLGHRRVARHPGERKVSTSLLQECPYLLSRQSIRLELFGKELVTTVYCGTGTICEKLINTLVETSW